MSATGGQSDYALTYKQLRGIIHFQELFKHKRQTVHKLNNMINDMQNILISVSNNIHRNYETNVLTVDQYLKHMELAESLAKQLQKYRSPSSPLPLTSLTLTIRSLQSSTMLDIKYLHYQVYELVKCCGAASCKDIIHFFRDGKNLNLNSAEFEVYNRMFTPVMVKVKVKVTAKDADTADAIVLSKYTSFTLSIILKLHGAEISIPIGHSVIVIKGYFNQDPFNVARDQIKSTEELTQEAYKQFDGVIERHIIDGYISQISFRDYVTMDTPALMHMMISDFKDMLFMQAHSPSLVGEFLLKQGIKKQVAMLALLLLDKNMHNYIPKSDTHTLLHWSVKKIYDNIIPLIPDDDTLPYEIRIEKLNVSEVIKKKAREKLKEIKGSRENSEKAVKYLDGLLRIPFGVYRKEPILCFKSEFIKKLKAEAVEVEVEAEAAEVEAVEAEETRKNLSLETETDIQRALEKSHPALRTEWTAFKNNRKIYLDFVNKTLESCIYGQDAAKRSIQSVIAQWINGETSGAVFGFQGYPGTGKTSLAKHGIAQCIKDDRGNPRPFFFISLGGSKGGSSLLGHSYTYVGSQCGKLAECLQNGKVMNPILYFDELDKVSESSCGEEIIRILTHLTDPEQNDHIEDRYFGIDMDLSKALLIFSYNNSRKIDSVLMDRIHEIQFKPYNRKDKTEIARKHLIPKILKSLGYGSQGDDTILFTDNVITYIIDKYTAESGVRDMKEKLTHVARDLNLRRIYNEEQYPLPFTVTVNLVDDILKPVNKIRLPSIATQPQIGIVNGLYATEIGTGGLTIIQVSPAPSDKKFHIELTGNLGDVMKESVMCAKTISWTVLPKEDRVWGNDALHIHFPSAGTNKDGPSAGAAITLAVVSYFSRLPVRNDIALTGEIDIHGNILPIGGLACKLEGAEKAGIKYVIIPRGNLQELQDIDMSSLSITVIPVNNIAQIISTCLIGSDAKAFNFNYNIDI